MVWFGLGLGLVAMVYLAVWIAAGKLLSAQEVEEFTRKKVSQAIRQRYPFSPIRSELDTAFKRAMNAEGAFYDLSLPLEVSLSTFASHFKYKKHEWIILALVVDDNVPLIWLNKGPDSSTVSPSISIEQFVGVSKRRTARLILRLHNHPNQFGASLNLLLPSEQDLCSTVQLAPAMNRAGVDFLDVVCERGDWAVFASSMADGDLLQSSAMSWCESLNRLDASSRRMARRWASGYTTSWDSRSPKIQAEFKGRHLLKELNLPFSNGDDLNSKA